MKRYTISEMQRMNTETDNLINGALAGITNKKRYIVKIIKEAKANIGEMSAQAIKNEQSSAIYKLIMAGMSMCIMAILSIGNTLPAQYSWIDWIMVLCVTGVYFMTPFVSEEKNSSKEFVSAIKILIAHITVYAIPIMIGTDIALTILIWEAALLVGTVAFIAVKYGLMLSIISESQESC